MYSIIVLIPMMADVFSGSVPTPRQRGAMESFQDWLACTPAGRYLGDVSGAVECGTDDCAQSAGLPVSFRVAGSHYATNEDGTRLGVRNE
jgi:hypothetical protein